MWYSLSKKSLLQFCWMKFDYFKIQMATAQMIILVEWTWRSLIFNNGSMYGFNFGLQKWSLRQIWDSPPCGTNKGISISISIKEDSAKYWPTFDYENWNSRLSLPLSFRTEQAPNFQEPHCKPTASIWYSRLNVSHAVLQKATKILPVWASPFPPKSEGCDNTGLASFSVM